MKLKKSSVEQASEETSGAYISNRLRNPGEEAAASSGPNETVFGIAAIIATVAMIIVAVVLYLNLDAFTSSGLFVQ